MSASHPSIYEVFDHQKSDLLLHWLENDCSQKPDLGGVMVFLRTRDGVHALTAFLNHAGVRAQSLHGNKKLELRDRALREFGEGKIRVLVMTEAVARAIDLSSAGHMVHYDFPEMNEDCFERSEIVQDQGGESMLFVSPRDTLLLSKLESEAGGVLARRKAEGFVYARQSERVKPPRKKGGRPNRSKGPRSKPLQNKKPKLKRRGK